MARSGNFKRVTRVELDRLLDQARSEHWTKLALVGPHGFWRDSQNEAEQVFQLDTAAEGLPDKLRFLPGLRSLNIHGNRIGDEGAKAIAALLPGLTSLDLSYNNIGDEGARAIAASLHELTSLKLSSNSIGAKGAKSIAVSLTDLTSLDLWGNYIGDDGAEVIAASLPDLTSLDLGNNGIGADGAKAIAASLAGLTSLNLRSNRIGADGAKAIAASLTGLTSLDLGFNEIGDDGAKAIAASLTGLTSLDLSFNSIADDGAKAIAASLSVLTSLDLDYNKIGDDGVKALASLTGLTSLSLWANTIGDVGARVIAASLTDLTSLDLSGCSIGDDGAMAVAASLCGLTSLNLGYNDIGAGGAKAIAASLTGLTSLNLSGNHIGDDGAMAIAASLTGLTSLNLVGSAISADGAKAISASVTGLTSLHLSDNSIGADGAKAIAASLTGLTWLDLEGNSIGNDGAKAIATSLTGLTSLSLSSNSIGTGGAKAIAPSLTGLTSLDLSSNGIGDEGAKAIAVSLSGLTSLDLTNNSIGDEGAKAIATSLTGLTSLNLAKNSIGDEGAKAIAASPTGLTSLTLSKNSIGDEGVRALLDAWSSEGKIGHLRTLDLQDNADLARLLPKEALETTDAQAILAAYRRFVVAEAQRTLRPLNEVKLLVVGNEAVGKTSLLRYLIEGRPRDPSEAKTPGIVQHEKIKVQGWSPQQCQVLLNVWDFGGQEMMRGTHRFFLTDRSLYLLVLEDRRQDDRSIHDWMKTIRNRGSSSPVVVVINKSDEGKQALRLDESGLCEIYPNIVAFLRTSCDPGEWAKGSIERLRVTIVETISNDRRLKHVQDPIPANWLQIKNRVGELGRQRSVLPHGDFIALCRQPGGNTEPVSDENEQRALLRLLHELGAIVAHGLERDAPAARREINLLDPNWLTGAVYRILDKASSVEQEGEFLRAQLGDWLDPGLYPPERHEFILDMMQDPDIALCFRLPGQREERYLLPEALPANRRFYGKWPEDSLRFRYNYNFLPPGLIPRFIVQSHRNLTPEQSRWRTGVVLRARDCEALVLADLDQRRVDIQVTGNPALRRAALNVILSDLDTVHSLNPEAEPVAVVPLPDRPEVHVGYEHLLKLERLMGAGHSFMPDGADRAYQVCELLDGVRRGETRQPKETERPAPPAKPHVIILVHGIRTHALWQNELRKTLEKENFVVQPTNYEYYDLPRFLFPWQLFAGGVVKEITRQVSHTLADNTDADCSIIAHSFGTFVVSRMLKDHTYLKFNRIIFCGSVVPSRFRFEDYRSRFATPIVNEVGTRDFWPVFAEVVTFGYGSAGTYGFRRPAVRDRWHNGKAHSDFLNPEFCRTYWIPFLLRGDVVEDDAEAERPPWWLDAFSIIKIKYVVLTAIVIGLWRWLT